jgi:hypothetical protein
MDALRYHEALEKSNEMGEEIVPNGGHPGDQSKEARERKR